jgi:hypothetical protein
MRHIIIALLALLATPLLVFAQTSSIVISRDPQGQALTILPLTIVGDATTASTTLFVRSASTAKTPHVRLSAQLFDATGQRVNDVAFSFTAQVPLTDSVSPVLVDAGTTAFNLPTDSGAVRVALSLSNLMQQGVFTGTLIAEVDGQSFTGPELIVSRLPAPQLKFNNMTDLTSFRLTRAGPDFVQAFSITSLNRASTRLRVDVVPLVGPDGAVVDTHWSLNEQPPNAEIDLPGLGTITVVVSANLPLTGTYTGGLAMIYNNQRVPADLIVNRVRPMMPIDVAGLQTVAVDLGLLARGDVDVRFHLNETGGQTVTLSVPDLNSLLAAGANQSSTQAKYDRVQVNDATGGALAAPFSIGPGDTQEVRLTIAGLQGAGEYNGTLRFTGPDYQPIERSIKILAREGWFAVAFFIMLGILLSSGIRYVTKTAQPRLNKQRLIRQLLQKIEDVEQTTQDQIIPAEREMLNQFKTRLVRQFGLVGGDQDKASDAVVQEIETKLPQWRRWVNLRRRIDVVQPSDLQTKLRQKLSPIGQQLLDPATTDQLNQINAALQQLDTDVTNEVKAALEKQIQELLAEMERAQVPIEMATKLKGVKIPLTSEELSEVQAIFEEARQAYVNWLIADLDKKIKGEPPEYVDVIAWKSLQSNANRLLVDARNELPTQVDQARKSYNAAITNYLQTLTSALQSRAEAMMKNLPSLPESQAQSQQIDAMLTLITGVNQNLQPGTFDLVGARQDLEKALQIWGQIQARAKGGAGALGFTTEPFLRDIAVIFGVSSERSAGEAESTRIDEIGKLPSLDRLNRQTLLLDAGLFFFTLVVAIVFGMKLLWIDSPTWGGWSAYLIAVLWGLGLHKVSEQAFDGLGWVRDQVTRS